MKISEHIAIIYSHADSIRMMSDSFSEIHKLAEAIQEEVNELDKKLTEVQEFLKNIAEGYGVDYEKLEELLKLF